MVLRFNRRFLGKLGLAALIGSPSAVWGEEGKDASRHCLRLIRQCQMTDGALRMRAKGDPVWVNPYFGNLAALALLSGKDPADRARVENWVRWYAAAQLDDGTINDWEGSLTTGYRDKERRDSVDSYAATYLMLMERFQRGGRKLSITLTESVNRAFRALNSVYDSGLTWAREDYKVKYLQDNVETYGGLVAAEQLFRRTGQELEERQAQKLRKAVAAKLKSFWRPDESLFAFAMLENGTYQLHHDDPSHDLGSAGMANLYGLTWISTRSNAWKQLKREFVPDKGFAPQAPIERWYLAALSMGSKSEADEWRLKLIAETQEFTSENVYLHRPAIAALALIEGIDWLPRAAGDLK